jgi:hypothetical protein
MRQNNSVFNTIPLVLEFVAFVGLLGCASYHISTQPGTSTNPPSSPSSITLTAPVSHILGGSSIQLTAEAPEAPQVTIAWSVNGIAGGSDQVGTITATGLYTAPPSSNSVVTVTAALADNPIVKASLLLTLVSPTPVPAKLGFAFAMSGPANTSAGVFDSAGTLVRTLWSGVHYESGAWESSWDGIDDNGVPMPAGNYEIRVLLNNVAYAWGVIGDTSSSWTARDSWDMQSSLPTSMVIANGIAYTGNGYSEGRPNASYFSTSSPQAPSNLITTGQCDILQYVATDRHMVYFANAGSGWSGSRPFVFALDGATHRQVPLTAGTTEKNCGVPLSGVIDPSTSSSSGINRSHVPTGIAVQENGNLLAVSHGSFTDFSYSPPGNFPSEDRVLLFDKSTGMSIGTIGIPDPQQLAFDNVGNLWLISAGTVVEVVSPGAGNVINHPVSNFANALAIAYDGSSNSILIAQGGDAQQIKRFSLTGDLLATYGQFGGYQDCDPTVSFDKFFFDSTVHSSRNGQTFISIDSSGTWWVLDPGNERVLHFAFNGTYIDEIAFRRFLYNAAVDHGNPTRVFGGFQEYLVDYSKDLLPGDPNASSGGNGSWTLVKNWGVCLPSANQTFIDFVAVHTFQNGRTYAELPNSEHRSRVTGGPLCELAELPSSGPIRFSGTILQYAGFCPIINHTDGLATWYDDKSSGVEKQIAVQQTYDGTNDDGFPTWSSAQVVATLPWPFGDINYPEGFGGWGMYNYPELTNSGVLVNYNTGAGVPGKDQHLGAVRFGGSTWAWMASPGGMLSTPDGHGTFPDNSPGGHNGITALVEGSNIIQGYDGQYGTFSSQWMHWWDDGLLVGQFGHPANGWNTEGGAYAGGAGNIATMSSAQVGQDIYLYNSDESYHPGVHRWRISNLGSIKELKGTSQLGSAVILQ